MPLGKTAKPLILVPVPIQDEEKRRYTLGRNYVRSVNEAGGVPVMAPVTIDPVSLRSLYDSADGVLLTGGADLDPSVFGEPLHPLTKGVDLDREAADPADEAAQEVPQRRSWPDGRWRTTSPCSASAGVRNS